MNRPVSKDVAEHSEVLTADYLQYVAQQVAAARADIVAGRTYSHEEVEEEFI